MQICKEKNRVYIVNDHQEEVAYVTFPIIQDGVVCIDHTVVKEEYRGLHLAGQLLENAFETIRLEGWKVQITCSYAAHWVSKHPEYQDLLI